jgi:hypothetical protein
VVDLDTTNVLLGIMAVVSVLEALLLIGAGIAGFLAYRRVMELVNGLEQRQIAPLMAKVNDILADVKGVTARVSDRTERVDGAIRGTLERVDDTADRVRANVRERASNVVRTIQGVRAAIAAVFARPPRHRPPAAAAGRV